MLFPFQWQDIPNVKGCANWCWMLMGQFWKWCLIWTWTAKIYGNEEKKKYCNICHDVGAGGSTNHHFGDRNSEQAVCTITKPHLFSFSEHLISSSGQFPFPPQHQLPTQLRWTGAGIAPLSFLLDLGPLELQTQPSNSNKHWRIYGRLYLGYVWLRLIWSNIDNMSEADRWLSLSFSLSSVIVLLS